MCPTKTYQQIIIYELWDPLRIINQLYILRAPLFPSVCPWTEKSRPSWDTERCNFCSFSESDNGPGKEGRVVAFASVVEEEE